jgi:hypothetical protein
MTERPDLEKAVDAALRRLPTPRAPETLVPRVMSAVRRRRPWYERSWLTWPLAWQSSSALVFAVMLAGLAFALPALDEVVGREALRLAGSWPARLSIGVSSVGAAMDAASVLWRVIVQPAAGCLIALVAVASMTCAATGAVLVHVTAERMSRS